MELYHATYKHRLESIFQHGLLQNAESKAYPDCPNYVYLCTDGDVAVSFAECSDYYENDHEIVLLKIDAWKLDYRLFSLDENMLDISRLVCFRYAGNVPAEAITLLP